MSESEAEAKRVRHKKEGEAWIENFLQTPLKAARDEILSEPEPPPFINEPSGYREPARKAAVETPPPVAVEVPDEEPVPKFRRFQWVPSFKSVAIVCSAIAAVFLLYLIFRTKVVPVQVNDVHWEKTIEVERYKVFRHEGFDLENGSFDVHDEGSRIHHYDHVQTGSHDESYDERYSCGENCRTIPGSCTTTPQRCTSNKNGSATCSGGDRVCSSDRRECTTKWCTRTKHRTVADYSDIPAYRTWYSWSVWGWGPQRVVRAAGATTETRWPSEEELALNQGLAPGEQERQGAHHEKFSVQFKGPDELYAYVPKSDAEFRQYNPGVKRRLKIGVAHGIEVLPAN